VYSRQQGDYVSIINKAIRFKRFELKENADLKLIIETNTGNRCEFRILNCSLSGISVVCDIEIQKNEGLAEDILIPSSKIKFEKEDHTLGRLLVRRLIIANGQTKAAFSTIDNHIPVDGFLSKFIKGEIDTRKSAYDFELSPEKFSIHSFQEVQNNVDLFHRMKQFQIYYDEWKNTNKFQYRNIRMPSKGERVQLVQSRKGNRNDYIVMGSNDYLGLASEPQVLEAVKKAIDQYGFGSTGSPLTTGLSEVHEELCELIANIFGKEKATLFNSGYAANVGTMTGLTNAQDLIVADFYSHASLQDGIQMAKATGRFFKHNDTKHLEKILREHRESHIGSLIVTEGVFSMDGDTPPLKTISEIAKKTNSRIFLDEAHSFGVVGPKGLGCAKKYPDVKVDIIMGTFSKICGGIGAFIAADKEVIHWLNWYARSQMFTVSIPPSTAAAALTALKVFLSKPELVEKLKSNIQHFVNGLRELGCPINANHESAVIPVIIGDERKMGIMNEVLKDNGVYVVPIIYPAVSKNNCRFRFTMMANHSVSDLDYVLAILEKAMHKADFKFVQKEELASREVKEKQIA
jgi:8-amino-7-oxononanoate synthase